MEATLQEANDHFSTVGVFITATDYTLSIDVIKERFALLTTRKSAFGKEQDTIGGTVKVIVYP